MTLIEEAITNWFGERCPDYEYGCPACDAWAEYDELNPSFGERLIEAATEAVTMAKLMRENEGLREAIMEERALCDQLYSVALFRENDPMSVINAYRKARGM